MGLINLPAMVPKMGFSESIPVYLTYMIIYNNVFFPNKKKRIFKKGSEYYSWGNEEEEEVGDGSISRMEQCAIRARDLQYEGRVWWACFFLLISLPLSPKRGREGSRVRRVLAEWVRFGKFK